MKITAILPCRNSAWVCGLSIRALLLFCDEVIVFNHCSTDNTLDILHQIQQEDKRLVYFSGTDPVWREMAHRQRLLESARERGATHIVTIDDDELVVGNMIPQMREMISEIPPGRVLQLPWIQLVKGIGYCISSGMWANNRASTAFVDDPRWHWAAQNGYDHHHRHPAGMPRVPYFRPGGLMHLQMASRRRLCAKHALYVMREVIRWPDRMTPAQLNAMYGPTVHTEGAHLSDVPPEWWETYKPLIHNLDLDAEPWQEAEVKRLWEEHGAEKFRGLDLYGVIART